MIVSMRCFYSCSSSKLDQNGKPSVRVWFVPSDNHPVSFNTSDEDQINLISLMKPGDECTLDLNYYDFRDENGVYRHGFKLLNIII